MEQRQKVEKITASRPGENGGPDEVRKFHPNTWKAMPPGKYGYSMVADPLPDAVRQNMAKATETKTEAKTTPKPRRTKEQIEAAKVAAKDKPADTKPADVVTKDSEPAAAADPLVTGDVNS